MIDLNVTFVIQLINFVVALVLINYVLIRPVRTIILKRKALRDELIGKARTFAEQTLEDAAKYEDTLRAAREEGARIRHALREEGLAQQSRTLTAANAAAAEFIQQERDRAAQEAEQARKDLDAQVKPLADAMAAKLLA